MILSDSAIKNAMKSGDIVIDPFDVNALGGNSYDVHLSPHICTHTALRAARRTGFAEAELDAKKPPPEFWYEIADEGMLLVPNVLYLASTIEYTETHRHVPYLDGKSSIGRLGIFIHTTAGRGDVGFCGHWTMEISVIHPIRVYAGMPIGQLTFHSVEGDVEAIYNKKRGAKYVDARNPKPAPSRMFKNFQNADSTIKTG